MAETDDVARRLIAAQVGALRSGSRVFNGVAGIIDDADDQIHARLKRGKPVVAVAKRAASKVSQQIEEELDAFAERRVRQLLRDMRSASGQDLKEPTDIGSLRMMRGTVEKFMDRAAEHAAERARFAVDNEETAASVVTRALRAYSRTVSRSGAVAAHNAAVLAIARANKRWISGILALATLDNRTTELCYDRHGGAWDVATSEPLAWSSIFIRFPGRPPWHFNCRTTLTPVFGDDHPTEETLDRDAWFDSFEAREAFGEKKHVLFQEGKISRTRLLNE